jgi:hypothetical protein
MLDNLRDQATFEPDEEEEQEKIEAEKPVPPKPRKPRRTLDQMTGTTDRQRLVLAVMFFIMVCLLGTMALIITGKVVLPIG